MLSDKKTFLKGIHILDTNARTDKYKKFHQALEYYSSHELITLDDVQKKYGIDARNYVAVENNHRKIETDKEKKIREKEKDREELFEGWREAM